MFEKMFENATAKLTLLYLAIIMVISLFFSFNLYQLSVDELAWGYQRQNALIRGLPAFRPLFDQEDLAGNQVLVLKEGQERILLRLFYVNLFILFAGGVLSYVLARKTLQPIERSHEAQSRFAADASHELRTPLTAMQTEIEVALRDPKLSASDARDLLQSNLEELAKLTKLSDGLLRLTRLDSESLPKSSVKVSSILKAAEQQVQAHINAKTQKVTIESAKSLVVFGDKASLVELVAILLENASKYSPAKSEITITTSREGQYTLIAVHDNGVGISQKDIAHVFDRFYRADTARTKVDTDGYGLGLSIAKTITDLHRGFISVSSTEGKGSTFTVKIPNK